MKPQLITVHSIVQIEYSHKMTEKRRRDRMNISMSEIAQLLPTSSVSKQVRVLPSFPKNLSRWEKCCINGVLAIGHSALQSSLITCLFQNSHVFTKIPTSDAPVVKFVGHTRLLSQLFMDEGKIFY